MELDKYGYNQYFNINNNLVPLFISYYNIVIEWKIRNQMSTQTKGGVSPKPANAKEDQPQW